MAYLKDLLVVGKSILNSLTTKTITTPDNGDLNINSSVATTDEKVISSSALNATQEHPGTMTADDKRKLDNLSAYSLPVASFDLGGVKSGTDITVDDKGNVSVKDNSHSHTIANITNLQTTLDNKIGIDKIGASNGVASLDDTGKVPSSQLPSYVDDVLEYAAISNFPATGETGKIYVDITSNLTYRWSGSAYVEISPSLALGETSSTAYAGNKGKALENKFADYLPLTGGEINGDLTISKTDGFKYTGMQNGTTNVSRNVWFSSDNQKGTPVSNDNFKYNPSTNILTVGSITGSAATLKTARTINVSGGASGTATSFNGSANIAIPVNSLDENYLSWGTTNKAGTVGLTGMFLSNEHNANRLAYLPGEYITIEYSTDGGATWQDYGASNAQKTKLVTLTEWFTIGKRISGNASAQDKLRITIDAAMGKLYCTARKMLINFNSQGAKNSTLLVEKTHVGSTEFIEQATYNVSGWSGWNIIPFNYTFGSSDSSQTSNYQKVRLTLSIEEYGSSTSRAQIGSIRIYGDNYYATPSEMACSGHLYTYDVEKNANFPGVINSKSNTSISSDSNGLRANLVFKGVEQRGIISYMGGNDVGFRFYEISPKANGAMTNFSEYYALPAPDIDRTTDVNYDILTSKNAVSIAQGGTGATTAAGALSNLGAAPATGSNEYYGSSVQRTANTVLAAPSDGDGSASFRKLVAADIPALNYLSKNGGTVNGVLTVTGGTSNFNFSAINQSVSSGTGKRAIWFAAAGEPGIPVCNPNAFYYIAGTKTLGIENGTVKATTFDGTAKQAKNIINTDYYAATIDALPTTDVPTGAIGFVANN